MALRSTSLLPAVQPYSYGIRRLPNQITSLLLRIAPSSIPLLFLPEPTLPAFHNLPLQLSLTPAWFRCQELGINALFHSYSKRNHHQLGLWHAARRGSSKITLFFPKRKNQNPKPTSLVYCRFLSDLLKTFSALPTPQHPPLVYLS